MNSMLLEATRDWDGEPIISTLNKDTVDRLMNMIELFSTVQHLSHRLEQTKKEVEAKRALFWVDMERSTERAETSRMRGKCLVLRAKNGKVVLCETEPFKSPYGFMMMDQDDA